MRTFPRPQPEQILALLEQYQLPVGDLAETAFENYFGAGDTDNLTGVVGVELHGESGLLRSLAVISDRRGKGSGKALVETAERHAQASGVKTLYLLTNTAERFFARLGYLAVSRETAPAIIQQSAEFSQLCPDDAVLMMKDISKGHFMSIFP